MQAILSGLEGIGLLKHDKSIIGSLCLAVINQNTKIIASVLYKNNVRA